MLASRTGMSGIGYNLRISDDFIVLLLMIL